MGALLAAAAVLLALAFAADSAGLGDIAWPALMGVALVGLLAGLALVARGERRLAALRASAAHGANDPPRLTDLELAYLFAGRFAPPAAGSDTFWAPLAARPVLASEVAWRAIGATVLDLAEADVVELEPRSLPTPLKPVTVLGVRLVRPLPASDAFAARLLRPLARRGVGASTILSDLVAQLSMMQRHPARALLDSACASLTAHGYYRARRPFWLRVVLPGSVEPDATRIAEARPALDALEARLAAWDERDAVLVAAIHHEVSSGLLRARARAGRR